MNSIYIYGDIGSGGWWDDGNSMSAARFVEELNAFGGEDVDVFVNSSGGDVFDGSSIYSAIERYAGRVTAHVDGLAASAASYCILSADEVVASPSALLMIHRAWSHSQGNADELRDTADTLEKLDATIAGIYARKSGRPEDEMLELMSAETWMTADEALEMGLVDSIGPEVAMAACVDERLFALYRNAPDIPAACNAAANIAGSSTGGTGDAPGAEPTGPSYVLIDSHVYQIGE